VFQKIGFGPNLNSHILIIIHTQICFISKLLVVEEIKLYIFSHQNIAEILLRKVLRHQRDDRKS